MEIRKLDDRDQSQYKLETVSRACAVMRLFQDDRDLLTLGDVVERTGFERTICFRILQTLEGEGFLRRAESRKYASNVRILDGKRFRVGYASLGHDSFSNAVSEGLRWAAREHKVDLIEYDNRCSATVALRNAEMLVTQRVELVMEFQVYERIAPKLSGLFRQAGIPVIAVDIPHPGALFFGVDNQRAGNLAGKALVRAAQREWEGICDELLLLDLEIAGSLPRLRLSGTFAALRKGLNGSWTTTHIEARGDFARAYELTRRHLQFAPKRKTLIAGVNDTAVLGALKAFDEAGRRNLCLAVAQGASPESRRELRQPNTRLAGSVAFFPERYGAKILSIALDLLKQKPVPRVVYAPVQLLTSENVNLYYPKDIFGISDVDAGQLAAV